MKCFWPDFKFPPINLWIMPKREEVTPCIKKCELNDQEICTGCKRTLQEIKDWPLFTLKQKLDIINRVKQETENND